MSSNFATGFEEAARIVSKWKAEKDLERKLYELAAKAAGIALVFDDRVGEHRIKKSGNRGPWAPLSDARECLYLARQCRMVLDWSTGDLNVRFWVSDVRDAAPRTFVASECGGEYLAIVLAAAEIGHHMP